MDNSSDFNGAKVSAVTSKFDNSANQSTKTTITVDKERGYGTITKGLTVVFSMEDIHLILRETANPRDCEFPEDAGDEYRRRCENARIFLRDLAKKALADVDVDSERTLQSILK
jgi:hypothetical protein